MASRSHNEALYSSFVGQMEKAATAAERKNIVGEMCRMFAVSKAKAYKMLHDCGWESGRGKRKDAGASSVGNDALNKIAALVKDSTRKNGKTVLSVSDCRSILQANGIEIAVGDSRLRSLLRKQRLDAKSLKKASPYQRMRTERPNQAHLVDPSLALFYYTPNGEQRVIHDDEVYKNKPFLEGKEHLKCWRYVLTDHYSASVCVRYYAAKGEKADSLYDFLLYAWGKKTNPVYGFHGLPEIVYWDCGSANKSRAVAKALEAFRVTAMAHLPGNPRAKGQVERANDLVERKFESRLRIEPVHSIGELNEAAERWCAAFNSDSIENVDSRLTRARRVIGTRYNLWNCIKAEDLRELPDPEICRQVFTTGILTRKAAGDLTVSILHPKTKRAETYNLAGLPGITVGAQVNIQPVLVDDEALAVASWKDNGKVLSRELAPVEWDRAGFDLGAPVLGKEFKRLPDTLIEKNNKELAQISAGLKGALKAHSFIVPNNPFAKPRSGEQVSVPDSVKVHDILVSHVEAARQVKARNGWLDESFIVRMKKEFPEGVPSSLIDDIAHEEGGEGGHAPRPGVINFRRAI